jgi:pyruvate-formate lyase-activating enzyme
MSLGLRCVAWLGDVLANAGLQPQPDHEPDAVGQFLTFVAPAVNGCNLKCSFCLVRQRHEITEARLGPEDYARFIREATQRAPVFAVAVQGYEPLLREAWPYTQAILATGRLMGVPTTLVTNGTALIDAVDLLKTLSPTKIAVSLDAASADVHDRIRGVAGAWDSAVAGIRRALDVLLPETRLVVASVLIPGKRHYLDGMPERLSEIGIDRWIVNPMVRVGRDTVGGPVGDQVALFRDLLVLQEAADRAGVRLTVDDEFGHLRYDAACAWQPALRALQVRTLPPNVELFRLSPGGQCAKGDEVLRRVTVETPRWQPGATHAGDFLAALGTETLAAIR